MQNPAIHRSLITSGCLLWCASFFGEAYGTQPYSTIGMVTSPLITVIGLIYWLKYYRNTRGYYPRFGGIIGAMFSRTGRYDFIWSHILEFWTFCILFWMGLALIMVLTFKNSDAFEATKRYCQANQEILAKTGPIKYYGVLVGGSITMGGQSGNADFSFTIIGEKGNFNANSKLIEQAGSWRVENVTLR